MTQVIAFTGGKGGVGKTCMAINTAIALARRRKKVMLFDADLGLANVNVILGLQAERDISHVLAGQCDLVDICLRGPSGVMIIPAASGIGQMANLSAIETAGIIQAFSELSNDIDVLIIDTAAGISEDVISFTQAAHEVVTVVCNDPASIADSYALIKVLHTEHRLQRCWVLANMLRDRNEGRKIYNKLKNIADKYLSINLFHLGDVPYDDYMRLAIKRRQSVLVEFPGAQSALAVNHLAEKMNQWQSRQPDIAQRTFFLEQFLSADTRI